MKDLSPVMLVDLVQPFQINLEEVNFFYPQCWERVVFDVQIA